MRKLTAISRASKMGQKVKTIAIKSVKEFNPFHMVEGGNG